MSQKGPIFARNFDICQLIFIILGDIYYRKFAKKRRCMIISCNKLCVAALPCRILLAVLVEVFAAKMSLFYSGIIFVSFCPNLTIFDKIIPDDYYW